MHLSYGIDYDGMSYSRKGDQIAYWKLDYLGMSPQNNYQSQYDLSTCRVGSLTSNQWNAITWTRLLPMATKNIHRIFWGLPPLQEEKPVPAWYLGWHGVACYSASNPENVRYTCPDKAKQLLESAGASRILRSHAYRNPEIGKIWIFRLPSAQLESLEGLLKGEGLYHLHPMPICWS